MTETQPRTNPTTVGPTYLTHNLRPNSALQLPPGGVGSQIIVQEEPFLLTVATSPEKT